MRKKILGATFVVAMAAIAGYNTYVNQTKVEMSDMAMANVEALAEDHECGPLGMFDFINNHEHEEKIPINSKTCTNGTISYKGVELSVESCTTYTYAIYHYCYDGGNVTQCMRSHLHEYI